MKKKKTLKFPVVKIYAFQSEKIISHFYGIVDIIYALEDKMCCIFKLQIDCDFYKSIKHRYELKQKTNANLYTILLKCDSTHPSLQTLI